MVLKNAFVATVCTACLAWGGVALADEYRPSEFFSLDLSRAVLSPKPLGPPAQFEPVPVEAKTDHGPDQHANVEPQVEEPKVAPKKAVRTTRVTAPHEKKRAEARVPARAKLARRHSNPLDAEARDTRIQTWPCRTGGICNWHR
ncbi:hypothetical protein ACVIHI_000667 [Bradyrhizobium sp. USDA 4524]|uniref:hypothetical protein n=1 Tax=unclassified Bradyrhizobium TaxID=2631580 RepID=UPI001CD27209|nr:MULTISPECIES: hypothetical protein [unclassified Bradyrhizobium]MCA1398719.1 hypothetical protein [Bradyrhizobium sp. BRP56]MCP1837960.1 hypothetical protein [Bradyrhizobium sp. USDA 4538]MCP1898525.1 hypothetical protein [Bradyrhizobium sp. USDA 4537]MCP1987365.1 hypothetical protein [Bradyrhizobium sp. USDA 4539]